MILLNAPIPLIHDPTKTANTQYLIPLLMIQSLFTFLIFTVITAITSIATTRNPFVELGPFSPTSHSYVLHA